MAGGPLLIINADDWGRTRDETDAALDCIRSGVVSSVTAMLFMQDSERAAEIARQAALPTGLHLNLTQPFTAEPASARLREAHGRVRRFLGRGRFASLVYNPALAGDFAYCFEAQYEEFVRLYGSAPTHVDGHHHQHVCATMLFGRVLPAGIKVRRTFDFERGEKGAINRSYRRLVNFVLGRRHPVTDYFFDMAMCASSERLSRVFRLARTSAVELMTHPTRQDERKRLTSAHFLSALAGLPVGSYRDL